MKTNEVDQITKYWLKSAEDDLKTAESLFASKRYHHCLFFCHLFTEKTLKALVVKKSKEQAPYEHNLVYLARISGISFSREQIEDLAEISTFNIRARYDDHKMRFYKKATRDYSSRYFNKSKEMHLWLKNYL